MTTKRKLLMASAGAGSGGGYITGDYYPIFALKLIDSTDDGANPDMVTGGLSEQYMRAALSLNSSPSYSSSHDDSSSLASIFTAASNGVSVDSNFGSGGLDVDAYRIDYHAVGASVVSKTASFQTSNSHNFYDDISDTPTSLYPTKSASWLGSISNVKVGATTYSSANVLINASTRSTRAGVDYWLSDGGDYCFMGVFTSMSAYQSGGDGLDRGVANMGIAVGISDSDGVPSSSQPPRLGISRRGSGYRSIVSVGGYTVGDSHSGNTTSGYIVLHGRVA